jgi:carbamoyltransferase
MSNLCLAGGVALNCVANGRLLREKQFHDIWVQPAAGDAGGALGAALAAYHLALEQPRTITSSSRDAMKGSFLGPEFAQADIERRLTAVGAKFQVAADTEFFDACVEALIHGEAIGWFQGRMEFGPRALGARSILADPRSPDAQTKLNLKVKYRESFRPFAPSVLREDVSEWFELDRDSPYMLFVADVHAHQRIALNTEEESRFGIDRLKTPRSTIPAVTHVDYSARVQTVHSDTNPRYHALLETFKRRTGCPILVNTSFNIRGEPVVCTPEDAFRCFMGTELDLLAIGNCVLRKADQDPSLRTNYRDSVTD